MIHVKISYKTASRGISIAFNGSIILESRNDHCQVADIGMNGKCNDIQIMQKPDFVALLEMVCDLKNTVNIPWFNQAMQCLSDFQANQSLRQKIGKLGNGLKFDDSGHLIGVDLSHLNLTGFIHLELLPQSVRTLDLSFNDLDTLNLNGLRGKSVERLNVERNPRCHIDSEYLDPESKNVTLRELELSFNQIFPWITNRNDKHERIRNMIKEHPTLQHIFIDGTLISQCSHPLVTVYRMLRVIDGVTNKQLIPWFDRFSRGVLMECDEWKHFGVEYKKRRKGYSPRYNFDLSGLGLEGHIDLRYLPRNVIKLDLSNNNLTSISLFGEGNFNLRRLNIQNNDHLGIDLQKIDLSLGSKSCPPLRHLIHLDLSSKQLLRSGRFCNLTERQIVREWLKTTIMQEVALDDVLILNENRPLRFNYTDSS